METLVLLLVFLFTVVIVFLCYYVISSSKLKIENRMNEIRISGNFDNDVEEDEDIKERKISKAKFPSRKNQFLEPYFTKKKKKLSQAYILMKPEEFFVASLLTGGLIFVFLFALTGFTAVGLFGFFIGFIIPEIYINSIRKKRGVKLNKQLPEALDIISNGLRAGLSFSQAMNIVGKDLESPISEEFIKVIRDNTLGKTMEDSLMDLTLRTDDEDLDIFVTAMIIQRQVGGNLSDILDTISSTIRERVRIKGEVKTLTAQSRISALVISVLPIGLAGLLSIINPGYMNKMFTTTFGLIMIGVAIILTSSGIFVLSRIIKLEV